MVEGSQGRIVKSLLLIIFKSFHKKYLVKNALFKTSVHQLVHLIRLSTPCTHTHTHLCAAAVQHVSAIQKVLVLSPGHHWLWQLSQVQLEQ